MSFKSKRRVNLLISNVFRKKILLIIFLLIFSSISYAEYLWDGKYCVNSYDCQIPGGYYQTCDEINTVDCSTPLTGGSTECYKSPAAPCEGIKLDCIDGTAPIGCSGSGGLGGGGGTGTFLNYDHYNPYSILLGEQAALVMCPGHTYQLGGVSGMRYYGMDDGREVWVAGPRFSGPITAVRDQDGVAYTTTLSPCWMDGDCNAAYNAECTFTTDCEFDTPEGGTETAVTCDYGEGRMEENFNRLIGGTAYNDGCNAYYSECEKTNPFDCFDENADYGQGYSVKLAFPEEKEDDFGFEEFMFDPRYMTFFKVRWDENEKACNQYVNDDPTINYNKIVYLDEEVHENFQAFGYEDKSVVMQNHCCGDDTKIYDYYNEPRYDQLDQFYTSKDSRYICLNSSEGFQWKKTNDVGAYKIVNDDYAGSAITAPSVWAVCNAHNIEYFRMDLKYLGCNSWSREHGTCRSIYFLDLVGCTNPNYLCDKFVDYKINHSLRNFGYESLSLKVDIDEPVIIVDVPDDLPENDDGPTGPTGPTEGEDIPLLPVESCTAFDGIYSYDVCHPNSNEICVDGTHVDITESVNFCCVGENAICKDAQDIIQTCEDIEYIDCGLISTDGSANPECEGGGEEIIGGHVCCKNSCTYNPSELMADLEIQTSEGFLCGVFNDKSYYTECCPDYLDCNNENYNDPYSDEYDLYYNRNVVSMGSTTSQIKSWDYKRTNSNFITNEMGHIDGETGTTITLFEFDSTSYNTKLTFFMYIDGLSLTYYSNEALEINKLRLVGWNFDSEGNKITPPYFNESLVNYVDKHLDYHTWLKVNIPKAQRIELHYEKSITTDIWIDQIVENKDPWEMNQNTKAYCTPLKTWVTSTLNLGYSAIDYADLKEWRDDNLENLKKYIERKWTCDMIPGYGWTGTKCCGEKQKVDSMDWMGPGYEFEYYNDVENGCWNGYTIQHNEPVAKETIPYSSISPYNGMDRVKDRYMFFDEKFRACGYDGIMPPGVDSYSNFEIITQDYCTNNWDYFCDHGKSLYRDSNIDGKKRNNTKTTFFTNQIFNGGFQN